MSIRAKDKGILVIDKKQKTEQSIPSAAVSRLAIYLHILENLELDGQQHVSSEALAEQAQVTAFQVRKDLSYFGRFGTRGRGYSVPVLRRKLIEVLGLHRPWRVVVVGMGRLGHAIADYPIAAEYRFEYIGLFDTNPALQGKVVAGLPIRPIQDLPQLIQDEQADMAFLTVPPEQAQNAAEFVIQSGIYSILNFAPITLRPPQKGGNSDSMSRIWHTVTIENVDLLAGMKRLAYYTQNSNMILEDL